MRATAESPGAAGGCRGRAGPGAAGVRRGVKALPRRPSPALDAGLVGTAPASSGNVVSSRLVPGSHPGPASPGVLLPAQPRPRSLAGLGPGRCCGLPRRVGSGGGGGGGRALSPRCPLVRWGSCCIQVSRTSGQMLLYGDREGASDNFFSVVE